MNLIEALKQLEEHFQGNEEAQAHIQALKALAPAATTNGTSDDPPPQPPGGPF